MPRVKYHEYMASREWRLKRRRILERANGMCERCGFNRATQVHHKTYARLGHEWDSDLQAICRGCHEYVSGETDRDPLDHALIHVFLEETDDRERDADLLRGVLRTLLDHPGKCGLCLHITSRDSSGISIMEMPLVKTRVDGPVKQALSSVLGGNAWFFISGDEQSPFRDSYACPLVTPVASMGAWR